jgi:acyl-CoA synthetase (AMP-forming)/AMP-acid ligase II/acyl carrier protein
MRPNPGPDSVPPPVTIGEIVDRWARIAREAPAVAARRRRDMSYGELAALTDGIARQLRHAGFRPDSRLAILHGGGAEMLTTTLGVVKCSIAVPVNHEFSATEFGNSFDACEVDAVLVDAELATPSREIARARGMRLIEIRRGQGDAAAGHVMLELPPSEDRSPDVRAGADDIAFVFGTSGTTLASKRVPLRHRHMVSRSDSTAALLELTPDDRCFNQNRLFLCSGISNSCTALYAGGCVLHPDEKGRFDLRAFIEGLKILRPTWYVASYNFNVGVHRTLKGDASAVAGHNLRFIRATSGHLDPAIVTGLEEIFGVPVIEAYSSTESGRICGNPLPPRRRKPGSVGLPTLHSEVSIVDGRGHPVKHGEQGEVVVRGACVFDGYDRNPTANTEAFFDDWYRTGDVGVFDQDGYLHLVGRIKEMINRGGQKISPVDVDEALVAHPDIADAAAFAVPHPMLGEVVGAAVVLEPHSRLSDRDILDFLRDRLEPIKWPRTFVFVKRIPRGPSGKVRRYEVAKLFEARGRDSRLGQGRTADDMATPTEARLAELWQWLLQKDGFGPDDDFFLAGGDSLAAMQLVLAANEAFDVELQLEVVFGEASTIRAMAARIDELRGKPKTGRSPDLPIQTIDERIALPARERRSDKSGAGKSKPDSRATDEAIFELFVLEKTTGLRRLRTGARLASVEANSHGFRSPEVPLQKPPGTIRLAFLGDSLTFGSWSGGNETTWPFHALETLRRAHGGSYDYVNAAMPGNGVGHLAIQFRESISRFAPDIVTLTPGASGNRADWARKKVGYSGVHYVPSWLGRRSFLCSLVEKNLVISLRQLRALSDRGKLTFEPHELRVLSQEFRNRLRDLVTECQKRVALVVLLTREYGIRRSQGRLAQIWSAGSRLFYEPYMSVGAFMDVNDEFNRVYREVAAETGALLVDIAGMLAPTKDYFEDSSHFTPLANEMIGERVGRALSEDPRFQRLLRERCPDAQPRARSA